MPSKSKTAGKMLTILSEKSFWQETAYSHQSSAEYLRATLPCWCLELISSHIRILPRAESVSTHLTIWPREDTICRQISLDNFDIIVFVSDQLNRPARQWKVSSRFRCGHCVVPSWIWEHGHASLNGAPHRIIEESPNECWWPGSVFRPRKQSNQANSRSLPLKLRSVTIHAWRMQSDGAYLVDETFDSTSGNLGQSASPSHSLDTRASQSVVRLNCGIASCYQIQAPTVDILRGRSHCVHWSSSKLSVGRRSEFCSVKRYGWHRSLSY